MLEIGSEAPSFRLSDQSGTVHDLAGYRGRWVVLYCYPEDDTSGCTAEACSFRDNMGRLRAIGAVVLGLSADDEASHRAFVEKHDLNFPLLVDPDRSTLRSYGAWVEKERAGERFMGVARMTFLVDPAGMVARVWPAVVVEGHVDDVIDELERLRGSSAQPPRH